MKGALYINQNGVRWLHHIYYNVKTAEKYADLLRERYGLECEVVPYKEPKKPQADIQSVSVSSIRDAVNEYLSTKEDT